MSICDLGTPRICLVRNATFENWPSWLCHQTTRSLDAEEGLGNFMKKDIFFVTSAREDSLKDAPTLDMLLFFQGHFD